MEITVLKHIYSSTTSDVLLVNAPSHAHASDNPEKILKIISSNDFNEQVYSAIAALNSKYICKPLFYEQQDGKTYIYFEKYVPLDELIFQKGLSLSDIMLLGKHVSEALCDLRASGLSHLDVRHSNVLFFENRFLLCDLNFKEFAGPDDYLTDSALLRKMICDILSDKYNDAYNPENTDFVKVSFFRKKISTAGNITNEELSIKFDEFLVDDLVNNSSYVFYSNNEDFFLETTADILSRESAPQKTNSSASGYQQKEKTGRKKPVLLWLLICLIGFSGICLVNHFSSPGRHISDKPSEENPFSGDDRTSSIYNSSGDDRTSSIYNSSGDDCTSSIYNSSNDDHLSNGDNSSCNNQFSNDEHDDTLPEIIDMSNMDLESLPDLSTHKNPAELYLSGNSITDLNPLYNNDKVKILVLSNNPISNLVPCKSLKSLRFLDLSNTKITTINSLMSLKKLTSLNILGCNIPESEIKKFCELHPDCILICNTPDS